LSRFDRDICIAFSSADAFRLAHQRTDRVEGMSAARLEELVALGSGIVESLQDKPLDWGREGTVVVVSEQWSAFSSQHSRVVDH